MRGDLLIHEQRCRALTKEGTRCRMRAEHEHGLCNRHQRWGAVIPDDWTQPDNIPVFYGKPAKR